MLETLSKLIQFFDKSCRITNSYCSDKNACGHLMYGEEGCEVNWVVTPKFRTGRKDCVPDPDAARPWMAPSNRHENHPFPIGNGIETVDWYKENFGLTARQAIALNSGAHSFGRFNSPVSYFAYQWTRAQVSMFNNQFLKILRAEPMYFSNCESWVEPGKKEWALVGDEYGNKPETSWRVVKKHITKNGGPYQWHHAYKRFGILVLLLVLTINE